MNGPVEVIAADYMEPGTRLAIVWDYFLSKWVAWKFDPDKSYAFEGFAVSSAKAWEPVDVRYDEAPAPGAAE